jgi:hypothetical protein
LKKFFLLEPSHPNYKKAQNTIRFEITQNFPNTHCYWNTPHLEIFTSGTALKIIYESCICAVSVGNFYTLQEAKKRLEYYHANRPNKAKRAIAVLELIKKYGGIHEARENLTEIEIDESALETVLERLSRQKINPVVIPGEWGIDCIPDVISHGLMEIKRLTQLPVVVEKSIWD